MQKLLVQIAEQGKRGDYQPILWEMLVVVLKNEYNLREDVKELKGISVLLDGRIDDFVGDCPKCEKIFYLGGEIINGRVKKTFFIN